MINIFKALSDETRLRILSLIFYGEICVCEIEKSLNISQSNTSRHLNVLKNAGIITYSKNAQWKYYKLNEDFHIRHKHLYEYLIIELKNLNNFEIDYKMMTENKQNDLCK
ncbi:MAG: metalloregulator ArsR/SmtB family transcription factor [Eubacteriaceae bacterium]